ncbi:GNAT family N-acetyltransferase [Planotetraspora mira]|uniref:GNAT family N-acetyltransferase n=1 Tax=Planotetraspora mira TaxID=58121 RepID=UPI0019509387|nr:GNAT family N-acetyltransferase [Planotetraspora mira]
MERDVYVGHAYSSTVLRQFLDIAGPLVIVAVEDGEVIGHTIALPAVSEGEAWLVALAVRGDWRKRGIGRSLSRLVLSRAVDHGYRTIHLTVEPDNQIAIGLYESLGFTTEGKVPDYFGKDEPRLVMRWSAKRSEQLLHAFA